METETLIAAGSALALGMAWYLDAKARNTQLQSGNVLLQKVRDQLLDSELDRLKIHTEYNTTVAEMTLQVTAAAHMANESSHANVTTRIALALKEGLTEIQYGQIFGPMAEKLRAGLEKPGVAQTPPAKASPAQPPVPRSKGAGTDYLKSVPPYEKDPGDPPQETS